MQHSVDHLFEGVEMNGKKKKEKKKKKRITEKYCSLSLGDEAFLGAKDTRTDFLCIFFCLLQFHF